MSDAKIQLAGGQVFDLLEPDSELIDIEVIAHSLSQLCRFTGHSTKFYSVAQHCVVVSRLVPAEDALAGLLHDAAEAFVGDVSTPLKRLLPEYRVIEDRIEQEIDYRFDIVYRGPQIKQADLQALATERRDLGLPGNDEYWIGLPEPAPFAIVPLGPVEARVAFLARFAEIVLHPGQGQAPPPTATEQIIAGAAAGQATQQPELDPNRFETNKDRSERLAREEEMASGTDWTVVG